MRHANLRAAHQCLGGVVATRGSPLTPDLRHGREGVVMRRCAPKFTGRLQAAFCGRRGLCPGAIGRTKKKMWHGMYVGAKP